MSRHNSITRGSDMLSHRLHSTVQLVSLSPQLFGLDVEPRLRKVLIMLNHGDQAQFNELKGFELSTARVV